MQVQSSIQRNDIENGAWYLHIYVDWSDKFQSMMSDVLRVNIPLTVHKFCLSSMMNRLTSCYCCFCHCSDNIDGKSQTGSLNNVCT
jgi:hypothetical protein